jgi:hypothetical protein
MKTKLIWKTAALLLGAGVIVLNASYWTASNSNETNSLGVSQVNAGWSWDFKEDDDCENYFWDCASLYNEYDVPCQGNYDGGACVNTGVIDICAGNSGSYSGVMTQCSSNGPDFCYEDSEC